MSCLWAIKKRFVYAESGQLGCGSGFFGGERRDMGCESRCLRPLKLKVLKEMKIRRVAKKTRRFRALIRWLRQSLSQAAGSTNPHEESRGKW